MRRNYDSYRVMFRLELNDGAHGSTVALFFCTRRRRGSVAQRGAAVAGRPSAFPVAGLMAATPPTSTDADPQSWARESVVMAAMACFCEAGLWFTCLLSAPVVSNTQIVRKQNGLKL